MPAGPLIAIHAGAGDRHTAVQEHELEIRHALGAALDAARAALDGGGCALDAVKAAIVLMEDFELFNAGRGSTLCSDGSVEMSAALMRADRAAGAVAGVRHTEHPILAAAAVLDSPQVLMIGECADALAERAGVTQRPNSYFVTERQAARLRDAQGGAEHATVGAVCLDAAGVLAAGTSPGGIRRQPRGRVADSPMIGAGTWADRRVAVSCTGDGEVFVRSGTARYIAALIEQGTALGPAAEQALADVESLGGRGGLIALDCAGEVLTPFVTKLMPRGVWRPGSEPVVWVM
jgi:beta-aspartyl-peptidase (threonine type)